MGPPTQPARARRWPGGRAGIVVRGSPGWAGGRGHGGPHPHPHLPALALTTQRQGMGRGMERKRGERMQAEWWLCTYNNRAGAVFFPAPPH